MKRGFFVLFLSAVFAAPVYADDEITTLVYPIQAAETELDESTPAKRVTPPVRENEEYDPVTPIGQIRGVLEDLQTVKAQNAAIVDAITRIQTTDNKDLLGLLDRASKGQEKIDVTVDEILGASKSIGTKIDEIKQTTDNLRASLEALQNTAASVERIRTSRWTDYAVIAILTLVLVQVVWRVGGTIYNGLKARAERWRVMVAAYEAQVANEKNETK